MKIQALQRIETRFSKDDSEAAWQYEKFAKSRQTFERRTETRTVISIFELVWVTIDVPMPKGETKCR